MNELSRGEKKKAGKKLNLKFRYVRTEKNISLILMILS